MKYQKASRRRHFSGTKKKICEEEEARLSALLQTLPYKQADMSELTSDSQTLIVLGNGFDLLHGARSSYWNFQETLGKNNALRFHLETYLQVEPDQLWYNFEESLSHINAGMMLDVVDMWLDDFGVYDEDDSMAAYYGAIDTAFLPIEVLCNDLPRRFRMWVESIKADGTKPLADLISREAQYLSFNYTDFPETLYHVEPQHICYIHGCRKKEKFKPKQKLVLGHMPHVDYLEGYEPSKGLVPRYKNKWKRAMLENAMEIGVGRWVSAYEEAFTKHTPEIIAENEAFFRGVADREKIITIGHSLSEVDYPYFERIAQENKGRANWFLGYHDYADMVRLLAFVGRMGIVKERVTVCRT